jgi:hypothetical protein
MEASDDIHLHASFLPDCNSDDKTLDGISVLPSPPTVAAPLHADCRPPYSLVTSQTIKDQAYPYTQDLLALASGGPRSGFMPAIEGITSVVTPLDPLAWDHALHDHPDRDLCHYISTGIRQGFRIGYDTSCPRQSTLQNMPSATKNPGPVERYLENEVAENRVIGPLPLTATNDVHINRFGVIPKRHQPGKWRLITDLSSPPRKSVNDGILRDLCSLRYESVDDAARIIVEWGRGTRLAKIDIAHAYRNVPVHPADRHLLGMQWKGGVYVDTALPFGLRPTVSPQGVLCSLGHPRVGTATGWHHCMPPLYR